MNEGILYSAVGTELEEGGVPCYLQMEASKMGKLFVVEITLQFNSYETRMELYVEELKRALSTQEPYFRKNRGFFTADQIAVQIDEKQKKIALSEKKILMDSVKRTKLFGDAYSVKRSATWMHTMEILLQKGSLTSVKTKNSNFSLRENGRESYRHYGA